MSSIFEGSEKKLEIVIKEGLPSLRDWPKEDWEAVVKAAGAQILSKITNEHCDAYLLSESSLFVWKDSVLLITCGTTTLVKAAKLLIEKIPAEQREAFFFERKNEYFPHLQKTNFYEDVEALRELLPGQAYRLGSADSHHIFLFHNDGAINPKRVGHTLEILMYDLQGPAQEAFNAQSKSAEELRKMTGLKDMFPGFEIDDYSFEPSGYSLNALREHQYFTIHVTPQEVSPYVSFETNISGPEGLKNALVKVLEVFRPQSFDVVCFDENVVSELQELSAYQLRNESIHPIEGGTFVQFGHFSQIACIKRPPALLRSLN